MNRKQIIIYVPNLSGGGTERFFTQLAKFLSKLEKYSVIYFYSVNSSKSNPVKNNLFIKLKKTIFKRSIFAIWEIIFFSWREKPSIILSAQNHPNVLFSLLRFLLPKSTKLIISERSFTNLALRDAKFLPRKILNKLIPIAYKNADSIHCLTNRIQDILIKKYDIPKTKINVIPNFIDLDNVQKQSFKKHNFSLIKKINNSPYIISIGRLHNQKGFEYLIKAFSSLTDLIPHKLVILGEGPLMNNLKDQVKVLKLGNKVIFAGFLKNPYPILKKADLFVLSSLYEGMPNALLEAISLNVPIVSSDCPSGPREILGSEYENLLYDPYDIDALAKLILNQINKPIKEKQTILEKGFSVEQVLKKYEKLINSPF